MCLIDFEKAFNMVQHELLVKRPKRLGVDAPDLRVLTNQYGGQEAVVRTGEERSGWTEI